MKNINKFITFEGIDGSGKTELIKMLCKYLEQKNIKYILTREPGGKNDLNDVPEEIREIIIKNKTISPKTELLLFLASRSEHYEKNIKKNLEKGYFVICDRFFDSNVVYQNLKGIPKDKILEFNNFILDGFKPKITFLIDVDIENSKKRIKLRNKDSFNRFDEESANFHLKAKNKYLDLLKSENKRIYLVENNNKIEDAFLKIKDKMEEIFKNELS